VIDRIGEGANLQEHWFDAPWTCATPDTPQPDPLHLS
jgi:hypothetical protein